MRFVLLKDPSLINFPFSSTLKAGLCFSTDPQEGLDTGDGDNFKYHFQLGLTASPIRECSLLLVPSWVWNTDYSDPGGKSTLALGIGVIYRMRDSLGFFGEWAPVLDGFEYDFDAWSGGIEITTAGHVFHIYITNVFGHSVNQYVPGGDLDLSKGDLRLGFNIYRAFGW
jgi:hypothetical protein